MRPRADILHLERLSKTKFELVKIDATYFVNRLPDAVRHLLRWSRPPYLDRLTNTDLPGRDCSWAVKQGLPA